MSDLDLTEAVEAAAEAFALSRFPDAQPNDGMTAWESLRPEVRLLFREVVLPVVTAAAPFIVAQATNTLICAESCAGQSWTGVDQDFGPDKVWRCDECDRIWEASS